MSQRPPPISDQPVLTLTNVVCQNGPHTALGGVTLQLRRGEIAVLLGTRGAGKTTLLHTISGMHTPSQGTVLFKGEDITGMDPSLIVAQGLSHVAQMRALFTHLSTHENLRMGAYTRTDPQGVLTDLDAVYRYFPALREHANRLASDLDAQQQLMLALSCAVMASPDLILLDDPGAGLSPPQTQEVLEQLVRINRERGVTLLIAENDTHATLARADYGYVLDKGQITREGTSATLRGQLECMPQATPARRLHETM